MFLLEDLDERYLSSSIYPSSKRCMADLVSTQSSSIEFLELWFEPFLKLYVMEKYL